MPSDLQAKSSSSADANNNLSFGPCELSILEYVLTVHGGRASSSLNRAAYLALLLHASLISRGARLIDPATNKECAVIDDQVLSGDPIRLSYNLVSRPKNGALAVQSCQLKISVAQTDSLVMIHITDDVTDKFSHLELNGAEQVNLGQQEESTAASTRDPSIVFSQLNELWASVDKDLLTPVLPKPPLAASTLESVPRSATTPTTSQEPAVPGNPLIYPSRGPPYRPHIDPRFPQSNPFPLDIGGSDLDPFHPFSGPSGRGGGMLMDPRHPPTLGGPHFGGPDILPPGAVPPGARFDPMGPGFGPPGGPGRRADPDPDHERPPGFDDMYM